MNVTLLTTLREDVIDDAHQFVTIGLNCWGCGNTETESLKNCKANAWNRRKGNYITRVAPKEGLGIDPVDGSIFWSAKHDAKNCPVCTVGKGIFIKLS